MIRSDVEAVCVTICKDGDRLGVKLRSMPDMLGLGRRILASQPFSVFLGAELLHLADGNAELRIPIRDELRQQHGFVHGGVISYAADNALTFAGASIDSGTRSSGVPRMISPSQIASPSMTS